jgi:hypothetical protein
MGTTRMSGQRGLRAIRARIGRIGAGRGLLILVILVAAAVGIWDGSARFRGAAANCVVGLTGAGVSISVDGPGAQTQCQSFLQTYPHSIGTWYLYADGVQPGGAVICQVPNLGDTFVVRDEGGRNGSTICQALIVANNAAASP